MNTSTQTPATTKKQVTLGEFFKSKQSQIQAALPKHLNADRMLRIVMTEVRKTPKLKECDIDSLFGAVIQSSQLGLEPGSALGHAYLIPYGRQCQFIVGYRGMIDLARRSGAIVSLSAHCVFENDFFEFEYGLEEKLKHIPTKKERGSFSGAYAIAHLVGGGRQIEVMWKNDIDEVRKRSKCANSGPWVTDYQEMAKKTVIRRLFKYLPVSVEIQKAIGVDEEADRGEQNTGHVFDVEADVVDENQQSTKSERVAEKLASKTNSEPPRVPEDQQQSDEDFRRELGE
jgi:recombination protein RecT